MLTQPMLQCDAEFSGDNIRMCMNQCLAVKSTPRVPQFEAHLPPAVLQNFRYIMYMYEYAQAIHK